MKIGLVLNKENQQFFIPALKLPINEVKSKSKFQVPSAGGQRKPDA